MKRHWIAKAGAAALIASLAGVASAQSTGSGLSARLGAFFPTDSSFGSTWFDGGIDYKLSALGTPVQGQRNWFGLSADYYTYGGNSNIPVVMTLNTSYSNLTFFVGAGIEFYDEPNFAGSSTGFDVQGGVNYDLASNFFLQAKYFLASRSELRGIGVYVGYHF